MPTHRSVNAQGYLQDFRAALARAAALKGPRTFIVEVRGLDLSEDEVSMLL